MAKKRILYVSQEITPYLPATELSKTARHLPQAMNESGKEVRLFMPRFGCINERRHQLHEVIRLSGMNLIINDMDQPLIIKVASVPQARMQVYFIDNEEYFKRKETVSDKDGKFFADNDERAMFFCRGVLETVKKLGWAPDIIHCHGWMASFLPAYLKKFYSDDPTFAKSKIIFSVYNEPFEGSLGDALASKLEFDGFDKDMIDLYSEPNIINLNRAAINNADAVIKGSEDLHADLENIIKEAKLPTLEFSSQENYKEMYGAFYDEILEEETVAK